MIFETMGAIGSAVAAEGVKSLLYSCGVELLRVGVAKPVMSVSGKLFQGVIYNPPFSWIELDRLPKSKLGLVEVDTLRRATAKKPRLSGHVACAGMFMASSLLNKGWWERKDRSIEAQDWRDIRGVQSWLYNGFYQWAPSWDVNLWGDGVDALLLGQLGKIDEADSIPVIVTDLKKARAIREELTHLARNTGRLVTHAEVHGRLCSLPELESRARGEVKELIVKLKACDAIRSSCLVVGEAASDRLDLHSGKACEEPYSGYMWKCVIPNEHKGKSETLPYSYFVSEHTNFADKDAINFNLDALYHKIAYIAERRNQGNAEAGVTLLQQMMPEDRLRGEPGGNYQSPEISVEQFLKLFVPAGVRR